MDEARFLLLFMALVSVPLSTAVLSVVFGDTGVHRSRFRLFAGAAFGVPICLAAGWWLLERRDALQAAATASFPGDPIQTVLPLSLAAVVVGFAVVRLARGLRPGSHRLRLATLEADAFAVLAVLLLAFAPAAGLLAFQAAHVHLRVEGDWVVSRGWLELEARRRPIDSVVRLECTGSDLERVSKGRPLRCWAQFADGFLWNAPAAISTAEASRVLSAMELLSRRSAVALRRL